METVYLSSPPDAKRKYLGRKNDPSIAKQTKIKKNQWS